MDVLQKLLGFENKIINMDIHTKGIYLNYTRNYVISTSYLFELNNLLFADRSHLCLNLEFRYAFQI